MSTRESTSAPVAPCKVLIVDDDDTLRQSIHLQLEREGYDADAAVTAEDALGLIQQSSYDLVLTDLVLPGISGVQLLRRIRNAHPETAVVVMTGYGTVETAVEAMKLGAYDYIVKPVQISQFKALVKRCLRERRHPRHPQSSIAGLDSKNAFENIIGSAPALRQALDIATRVAATDATVLILGETGTGKELVARSIHSGSPRRSRPFLSINCAAIPRELLESELFGYLKGSFTGALNHKRGKIEMASGGTLLLDEIGDMPLDLQVRILRLIQEREIDKVGAISAIKVDVRILAATHRNLAAMVREGTFREDLYYRLLVIPIHLPPLRERPEDIEPLASSLFAKFRAKYGRTDLNMPPDMPHYLLGYGWPGNVRELENTVERMVLLAKGPNLTPLDLPDFLCFDAPDRRALADPASETGLSLRDVERNVILQALRKFDGNQTRAAQYLKVTRRTLAYRLEQHGLSRDELRVLRRGGG